MLARSPRKATSASCDPGMGFSGSSESPAGMAKRDDKGKRRAKVNDRGFVNVESFIITFVGMRVLFRRARAL